MLYYCVCMCLCAVPSPRCESAVSDNGAIAITWSLTHTGGLPLASLSISYSYTEGLNIVQGDRVAMVSVDDTSAPFSELVTGFAYTFTVTAVNSLGSSMSVCAPVEHLIGELTMLQNKSIVVCQLLNISLTF